jgi:fructose-1,6-bisphosphatase/inositol monophosphatase family enzyme
MSSHYQDVIENLRQLGESTRDQQDSQVETARKADRSLVTNVDRSNEAKIVSMLDSCFPADAVHGEEGSQRPGDDGRYLWLIDPIDGTRQFVHGQPFWGILVARLLGSQPVFGAIYHPSTNSVVWAESGAGCYRSPEEGRHTRLFVSGTTDLSQAYLLHNGLAFAERAGAGPALSSLCRRVDAERGYADSYGHVEVISGRADLMIDCLPEPHDIAAVAICVAEAGGEWFSVDGGTPARPGPMTVTTNRELGRQILDVCAETGAA